MNANELFDIILVGLADFDEVKLLALMMLQRLAALAEGIVAARLDDLVESIENIAKPIVAAKDDTEQDVQRKVSRDGATSWGWFYLTTLYSLLIRRTLKRPPLAALRLWPRSALPKPAPSLTS